MSFRKKRKKKVDSKQQGTVQDETHRNKTEQMRMGWDSIQRTPGHLSVGSEREFNSDDWLLFERCMVQRWGFD
ncbi:hypothetical protein LOAG_05246 [Loa loa]|nr:hypothetical protein LOAG_05246 [Loa loa]EFO23238.1 hypothetical protein LOAG_05246 [Loa loa]